MASLAFRFWTGYQRLKCVLKPTWFTALSVLLICLGILGLPQARDVMEEAERSPGHLLVLTLATVYLALSAWFFSRALLYVHYWYTPTDRPLYVRLRRWAPRLYGMAPALALAWVYLEQNSQRTALVFAAIAGGFLLFTLLRRAWLRVRSQGAPNAVVAPRDTLMPSTLRVLGLFVAVSVVLLAVFLLMPVLAPRAFGTLPIVLAAAAGWMAFANLALIYPCHRFGTPSLLVLALVLAGLFSVWNDNHEVRQLAAPPAPWQRPAVSEHFQAWLTTRVADKAPESGSGEPYPVFVVAAAGGGIRAAYWTALVLAEMADRYPRFVDHVYALSGVSGGSLGSAVFAALIADRSTATGATAGATSYLEDTRAILGQDFLSPVVAGMLFPDLLQRFWPVPDSVPVLGALALPDRARYLEQSWEVAWRQHTGNDRFAERFADLWQAPVDGQVPALLLNTTWVDDGSRAVVSNLSVRGEHFLEVDDLLSECPLTLPLSAAVHLSARFTYVSPAGTVYCQGRPRPRRLVDGGYFENAGALTAFELLNSMLSACTPDPNAVPDVWACPGGRVRPVPLLVSNDPARGLDPPPTEDFGERVRREFLLETRAPIRTLLNTRTARGLHAEAQLKAHYPGTLDVNLVAMPEQRDPPLGWLLSLRSREFMERQLASGPWIEAVGELLPGPSAASAPP
jgi:hypothetical protein